MMIVSVTSSKLKEQVGSQALAQQYQKVVIKFVHVATEAVGSMFQPH